MKTALVISSFVSSSQVGANTSAFCLRRMGIETHVMPTVLLGRHPGWGAPGGGPVNFDMFESLWDGIQAQNISIDAIMTGYVADAAQVHKTAEIIAYLKRQNPTLHCLVDPVMGDAGRLYVPETVAQAIITQLVPLADTITPNLWELGYITGTSPDTLHQIERVAIVLGRDVLVTSVPVEDKIGALLRSGAETGIVRHEKFDCVPHGGGDALAATYLAHILNDAAPGEALSKATAAIFDMLSSAVENDLGELPLIRRQSALLEPIALDVDKLPTERPARD